MKENNPKDEKVESEEDFTFQLNKSRTLDELLEYYNKNPDQINIVSIMYFVRKIRFFIYGLDLAQIQLFSQNKVMFEILTFMESNLSSMNEYQFVEILVLLRKFKSIDLFFEGKMDSVLNTTIKLLNEMISNENMRVNVKVAAQIFQEFSLLHLPTKPIFDVLNKLLNDKNQQIYFTGYSISVILKACAYNFVRNRKNYYGDFCYKILNLLEKHLPNFEITFLCRLFKNICVLKLNFTTSHKKLHPCLLILKGIIQEKKGLLQEKDVLCLLEAFIHSPVSFDNAFLLYLKSSTLYTIQENPLKVTLKFLIKFVDLMGQLFQGIRLNNNSLENIGKEILKRLQLSNNIKFSLIYDCFKAFGEKNHYYHKSLFEFLYEKLTKTPENEINVNLAIFNIKILLNVKFDCKAFLFIVKTKILKNLKVVPVDKLLDLLYIYSYPTYQNEAEFQSFSQVLSDAVKTSLESNKLFVVNSFLFILARDYSHVKNPFFMDFQNIALKLLKENWDTLRIQRKFDLALSFINVRYKRAEWGAFLMEKTINLDETDLNILLNQYFYKETKEYNSFNLVLNALITTSDQIRQHSLKNILSIFIKTPTHKVINFKGNPNQNIFKLIEILKFDINIHENKISYTDVLKFSRFFNILDLNTEFLLPIFFNSYERGELIKNFEIGDIILGEIGTFMCVTILLSPNYQKLRKTLLQNENNEINLIDHDDNLKNSPEISANIIEKNETKKEMHLFSQKEVKNYKITKIADDKLIKFEKVQNILMDIFINLKTYFDNRSKKASISLGWLTKFLRIYLFLYENNSKVDKDLGQQIYIKIKENMNNRTIDNKSTIIKAMFTLIELDVFGSNFNLEQKEFIKNKLAQSLDMASTPILLPHLKLLQKKILNSLQKKNLKFYLGVIEKFYIQNDMKKFPNVISNFLFCFATFGVEHTNLYNKIIENIQTNIEQFQPNNFLEILDSLSILKIKHQSLAKNISALIKKSIFVYDKNIPDILFNYAKLGFDETWCKEFCYSIWNHYKKQGLKETFYRPIDIFWSLLVLNLTSKELIETNFLNFQNYILNSYAENLSKESYISEIIYSLKFLYFDVPYLQLSPKFLQKLENSNFLKKLNTKDIPIVQEILKKYNEDFIKNYLIDDSFLVNIYLPKRKMIIVFDNSVYVSFDNFSSTGHDLLRIRILEKIKETKGLSYIKVNELIFNNFATEELRINYLAEKGLDLNKKTEI